MDIVLRKLQNLDRISASDLLFLLLVLNYSSIYHFISQIIIELKFLFVCN